MTFHDKEFTHSLFDTTGVLQAAVLILDLAVAVEEISIHIEASVAFCERVDAGPQAPGAQIVEKTPARNVGGLAVVADASKVVRAGAAAGLPVITKAGAFGRWD